MARLQLAQNAVVTTTEDETNAQEKVAQAIARLEAAKARRALAQAEVTSCLAALQALPPYGWSQWNSDSAGAIAAKAPYSQWDDTSMADTGAAAAKVTFQ